MIVSVMSPINLNVFYFAIFGCVSKLVGIPLFLQIFYNTISKAITVERIASVINNWDLHATYMFSCFMSINCDCIRYVLP